MTQLIAICILLLAECQSPDISDNGAAGTGLKAISERNALKVGTIGDYQPMSFLEPKTEKNVGFDTELAVNLAKALNVSLEYVETSWPALMEDTLAGKLDLVICGIHITDARKEQALIKTCCLQ